MDNGDMSCHCARPTRGHPESKERCKVCGGYFCEPQDDTRCGDCRFYEPEIMYMKGDSEDLREWGGCNNPKLTIDGSISFIRAGADDDYGAFFQMKKDFGCIFFENNKEAKSL